ncbi:Cation/H+ exchanger [Corchorus olitorius]|uniref:Cation/H+ exchanger n=1 Tax=Corchorus olitorius TaxID=93759 RepID=A0A1R3K351_9ROSI|nr:Cation/H+ exchanger [Corchorus olitorius]
MDIRSVYKAGRKAICIGVLTVLVPIAACLITDRIITGETDLIRNKNFFFSITYSGTSFPVIHILLSELKILNSELGRLGLSAAIVSDMVSVLLVNIGNWVNNVGVKGSKAVLEDMGLTIAFVVIVFLVLRPGMKWFARRTPEGGKINDVFLYAAVLLFMLSPTVTSLFRAAILFGPFFLGLATPDGPPLGSTLVEKFEPLVSGIFLPLFVSTCGMRMDLEFVQKPNKYAKDQIVAALVTLIFKFFVSLALPLSFKMPKQDSLALAFIMITKGVFEIGVYSMFFDAAVISEDIFNIMSIMTVLLASIVPIAVRKLYDPSRKYLSYKKRSILNSKVNEDLRVIGCIHVPGNVKSIINMLNACSPSKESPIALDVLHLVKLSGRATPLFIAHQKHGHGIARFESSYSENIVLAFNQFERDNWEAVSVNVFTAVSPRNLMYEDICNLAMNNLTSFIILPFHRRYNADGSIESEDQAIRSLNCSILDKSPCSVGILVEGHRSINHSNSIDSTLSSDSSPGIAVIFLGGKDDREALALARRISIGQRVGLTVIHIKPSKAIRIILADDDSDTILNDEMLRITKEIKNIRYIEKEVNDGPETSTFLRPLLNDYQLVIAGRRYGMEDPQTFGLEEWIEFKEIGIIGDLVSSQDFGGNYSVLIVQQQQLQLIGNIA